MRGGHAPEGPDREQLRSHAEPLDGDHGARRSVLTPGPARPVWSDGFDAAIAPEVASRIIWRSFRQLAVTLEELPAYPSRLLSERLGGTDRQHHRLRRAAEEAISAQALPDRWRRDFGAAFA